MWRPNEEFWARIFVAMFSIVLGASALTWGLLPGSYRYFLP